MKRLLQLVTLAAIALSLNSCGLPAALARTAGNVVNSAGGLVGPALGL
jgi:hypothetical protein